MKKSFLKLSVAILCICLLLPMTINADTVMYAPDGRIIRINDAEVEAYKSVGWYTNTTTTMYSLDGRNITVPIREIQAHQNVGWYLQPVTLMYAADGRTLVVFSSEVEAYKNVGWYTDGFITMYSLDGRVLDVHASEIHAHQNVGWYLQPVTLMYAADGRSLAVASSEIEAYKAVGWYLEPVTLMYAKDGRTLYVLNSEVDLYKSLNWYLTPQRRLEINPSLINDIGKTKGQLIAKYGPVSGTYWDEGLVTMFENSNAGFGIVSYSVDYQTYDNNPCIGIYTQLKEIVTKNYGENTYTLSELEGLFGSASSTYDEIYNTNYYTFHYGNCIIDIEYPYWGADARNNSFVMLWEK